MKIIGLENCPRCKKIRKKFPQIPYVEIPCLSLGFGDTFAKFTHFLGIEPCSGCRIRQGKWNKWIPYRWRFKRVRLNIRKAKAAVYKLGATQFPVVTNDRITKIIKDERYEINE